MATIRACLLMAMLGTAALLPAQATTPDYKLGDVALDDVITPVPLLVVDLEATDALKQKLAQEILFVVRHVPQASRASEVRLRASLAAARTRFIALLQEGLQGRAPNERDAGSPVYVETLAALATESPKNLPLGVLAPLWIRGQSDEPVVEALLQPVRDVMAQPIVGSKTESPLPSNQPVRLLAVKSLEDPPTARELADAGQRISAGLVLSLWRARRLVETSFPAKQEALGKFASAFVEVNAVPDAALTDILRARRMEGVTANETYAAAQTLVRKGQLIDRKALAALAAMREKSLIGSLQSKLAQEDAVARQLSQQATWIAAGLGAICLVLLLILWRLRARPEAGLATLPAGLPALRGGADSLALADGAGGDVWRQRALLAEGKADRAHAAIRSGVLGWMREKLFHTLFRHRAELMSAQQRAEVEMGELERRLEQLHTPLQERVRAYEKRIEDLEQELAAKGEENRELIGARIAVARQQLIVERERSRFSAN